MGILSKMRRGVPMESRARRPCYLSVPGRSPNTPSEGISICVDVWGVLLSHSGQRNAAGEVVVGWFVRVRFWNDRVGSTLSSACRIGKLFETECAELFFTELAVESVASDQVVMVALFDDTAVVDHEGKIARDDR